MERVEKLEQENESLLSQVKQLQTKNAQLEKAARSTSAGSKSSSSSSSSSSAPIANVNVKAKAKVKTTPMVESSFVRDDGECLVS